MWAISTTPGFDFHLFFASYDDDDDHLHKKTETQAVRQYIVSTGSQPETGGHTPAQLVQNWNQARFWSYLKLQQLRKVSKNPCLYDFSPKHNLDSPNL